MSVVWYIEYEGAKRTLSDWGVEASELTEVNQASGSLVLETVGEGANAVPKFEFEKEIILWRGSVRWFRGPVIEMQFLGGQKERHKYTVASPWWYLENIIFQQPWWVLKDAEEDLLGYTTVTTSRTVMGMAPSGARHDTGGQAAETVDYAIQKGAPIARGTFELTTYFPYEKGEDLTCAEALRRVLRWTRDAVAYWEYTDEVPTLQIKKRSALAAASIDLDAADSVTHVQITPRNDIVPRGVFIRFRRVAVDWKGAQYVRYTNQTAGDVSEGIRCLSYTISLAGVGSQSEPEPYGLAAALYGSLSQLEYEGELRILEEEVSGAARVGNTLNILNGKAAWETMGATIQSTTYSLLTGETRLNIGPPSQLGLKDFIDLARFRRGQDAGGAVDEKFKGTPADPKPSPPPGPPPGPPGDPNEPVPHDIPTIQELEVCQGGKKVKIRVTGTRVS